jgi:serine/threonine-protein kinase
MRCLDRARAGLVATLAHLVEARSVDGALASVEALPLVSACGDLEALRAPVPPPDDPVARVRLTELEARLAEVFARTAAADLDAAQDLAATLVEDAERLGYRPFLAEALLAKGLAEAQAGEPRAFATLDEALLQAQAGGHDAVLARAAIALLTFAETRDDEDRYGWARLAGATIEKLGTPPALAASHRGALGSFHMKAGRFPEGLPLLREALAFSERAGQAGTLGHSVILNDLGNALGVAGAGEASMARLEEALALRLRLLGEDHPNVAATLINIGVEHNMRGRPEKALVPLERARAIALGLDDRFRHLLAKVDAARAASFSQLGRHDESIAARRAALEEKLYPDDAERLADAHLRLGSALRSGGRADEAQPALDRALELISRGRPEDHPDRVRYLIARGDNLIVLRRAEEAIRECERAAAIVTRVYGPTRLTLVYAWTCLGEGALALGRREEARERFERAAALAKVLGADPRVLKELERLLQEAR